MKKIYLLIIILIVSGCSTAKKIATVPARAALIPVALVDAFLGTKMAKTANSSLQDFASSENNSSKLNEKDTSSIVNLKPPKNYINDNDIRKVTSKANDSSLEETKYGQIIAPTHLDGDKITNGLIWQHQPIIETKNRVSQYDNLNTFDAYLSAFNATGDIKYIEKAYSLSKNTRDKEKIELSLIKNKGIDSVFDVSGNLNGNKDGGSSKSATSILIINTIKSDGQAIMNLHVKKKSRSNLPLKYGHFKVKINAELELSYRLKTGWLTQGDTKIVKASEWIELNPKNNWENKVRIDMGKILHDFRSGIVDKWLDDITTRIVFEDIELI